MNAKISILTTLFNHELFIKCALDSALAQTLSPVEIVVLDDASTDGSVDAARSVVHPSIKLISEKRNLGGANTAAGLGACNGDQVAILNSDDAWAPRKLELQSTYMESAPQVGVVFTHVEVVDERGIPWADNSHQRNFNAPNRSRHQWLRHFFLIGNPFCASSALIRSECFDRVGRFDGSYVQLQDLDMWIRIAIAGYELHVVEEPLTYYRVMRKGGNLSSDRPDARAANSFEYAKTLRNYWNISSLSELVGIFPEINVSDHADDSLVLFYLAQYAAKLPSIHHQLFALETMSKWGGQRDAMSLAHDCHGFDFVAYRNFFSYGPIRKLLRLNFRHQVNSLALKVLPGSAYQYIKAWASGRTNPL